LRNGIPPRLIFLFAVVGVALLLVGEELSPELREGPMVASATEESATIVWFPRRPGPQTLVVSRGGEEVARIPVVPEDGRCEAAVTGLAPGAAWDYRIETRGGIRFAGTFRTNRPRGEPFRFVVFGDSGSGSRAQHELAGRMELVQPDFLLHTGDVVYPDGERGDYAERFFAPYRRLIAHVPFRPCVGNHDVPDPGETGGWRRVFTVPENGPGAPENRGDYWFDYGEARFVVVDSENPGRVLAETTAPWIERVLADPAPRWRLHCPPYASPPKMRRQKRVRKHLVPVLERAGVDVAFCGHRHYYERFRPLRGGEVVLPEEGIVWVTTGGGGGDLDDLADPLPPAAAAGYDEDHSFTLVEVDGPRLRLRQISRTGETVDDAGWTKPGPRRSPPAEGTDR